VVVLVAAAAEPSPIVLVSTVSVALLGAWLALFVVYLSLGGDPEVRGFELGHDSTSSEHH
jgi:hypothetical protein